MTMKRNLVGVTAPQKSTVVRSDLEASDSVRTSETSTHAENASATASWPRSFDEIRVIDSEYRGEGRPIAEPDLVRWILLHPRAPWSIARFIDALCWRLIGSGVPLSRVSLFTNTLHPQIDSLGWRWWRDRGVTEEFHFERGLENTPGYAERPIYRVIEQGVPLRRRLEVDRSEFPLLAELAAHGATDYLAMPLSRLVRRYAVVTWTSDRPGGFSARDLELLEGIRPALAVVMEANTVRRAARTLLSIYLSNEIGERIFDGQVERGKVQHMRAVVMASDLRGFTSLSDRLPGEVVIRALDDYFEYVADAVNAAGGFVLKFVGDGVLALFPTDTEGEVSAVRGSLDAARTVVARLAQHNAILGARGTIWLRAGFGLHIGDVMLGNVGSHDRLDFTAIGPAVNMAFRLEGLTKHLDRPVLTSQAFAEISDTPLHSLGFHPIRGFLDPAEVFGLPEHESTTSFSNSR